MFVWQERQISSSRSRRQFYFGCCLVNIFMFVLNIIIPFIIWCLHFLGFNSFLESAMPNLRTFKATDSGVPLFANFNHFYEQLNSLLYRLNERGIFLITTSTEIPFSKTSCYRLIFEELTKTFYYFNRIIVIHYSSFCNQNSDLNSQLSNNSYCDFSLNRN